MDTTIVQWQVTDIHGNTSSCAMNIVVWNFPTVSDAGEDDQFCEDPNANNIITFLDGNTPDIGDGVWTVTLGPATVVDSTNPGSLVENLQYGSNIFQWTISNGVCEPSIDEVEICLLYTSPSPRDA